ncbi:MAG: efflux RND transporter periplasmic adaptor subunit [Alphaproteobacteria bacterium]|nr:efflux RND transporter periplasmic adaptor subunit [Alphaproteobacteria bacterium]
MLGFAGWAAYDASRPLHVAVVQPTRGPAVEAAYATGTVEPSLMLPIAPRSTARLVALEADEGDHVSAGQLLARLEDDDLRRALDAARAVEANAHSNFERNAELVKEGRVSRQAYDQAKSNWEAATAEVARLEAQLGFLSLRAPSEGTIIRRDGEVGELIVTGNPVFWMAGDAPLRITSEVDEEDIARIRPGQKVLIRADAFPGEVLDGTVSAVTPKGDATARSYRVRIAVPAGTRLMIGMTTETNIVLREEPNALLVPTAALEGETLWLVVDGRLAKRQVKIGARGNARTEILSGVADGDWIAAAPSADFADGEAVAADPSG